MSDHDRYETMTMCHCDDPDECDEHWAVGIPKDGSYRSESGHVTYAMDVTSGFHTRADAQLFADAKNRQAAPAVEEAEPEPEFVPCEHSGPGGLCARALGHTDEPVLPEYKDKHYSWDSDHFRWWPVDWKSDKEKLQDAERRIAELESQQTHGE